MASKLYNKDWAKFVKNHEVKRGAYNIWVTKPEYNFGYKIFTNDHGQPRKLVKEKEDIEILNPIDLDRMFMLLTKASKLGCCPKPINIFTNKSISGIKIEKADLANEELYNNRHKDMNFEGLKEFLNEGMINYLSNEIGITNYGEIAGKLVIIDFDMCTLAHCSIISSNDGA